MSILVGEAGHLLGVLACPIATAVDVLVPLDTLPHDLVDVVDVVRHIGPDVGVQGLLVLLELLLLLLQEYARLVKILVEVETHLVLDALLDGEDVVLHHAVLPGGDV